MEYPIVKVGRLELVWIIFKEWIRTAGIYKHLKTGGWYVVFGSGYESTNGQGRSKKIIYLSLKNWSLNLRDMEEFFQTDIVEVIKAPQGSVRSKDSNDQYFLVMFSHRFLKIFPPHPKQPVISFAKEDKAISEPVPPQPDQMISDSSKNSTSNC